LSGTERRKIAEMYVEAVNHGLRGMHPQTARRRTGKKRLRPAVKRERGFSDDDTNVDKERGLFIDDGAGARRTA
jgi:hypothetical protein